MYIKKILFLVIFISLCESIYAQEKVSPDNPNYKNTSDSTVTQSVVKQKTAFPFKKTWRFGGNIGLAFWSGGTDILIAPKAYYQITPQFMTGFGLTYIYSNGEYIQHFVNHPSEIYDYSSNSAGVSLLAVYRPIPFLQLSAEFEELYTNYNGGDNFSTKYWNDALYLGVSFVSGSGNVAFGFQYNILYDDRTSAYASAFTPIISFYF